MTESLPAAALLRRELPGSWHDRFADTVVVRARPEPPPIGDVGATLTHDVVFDIDSFTWFVVEGGTIVELISDMSFELVQAWSDVLIAAGVQIEAATATSERARGTDAC
jgi:hypothetical protein